MQHLGTAGRAANCSNVNLKVAKYLHSPGIESDVWVVHHELAPTGLTICGVFCLFIGWCNSGSGGTRERLRGRGGPIG